MGKRDNRIDAYIAKSQEFARPILSHLRDLVHTACPDVEETIKWGFPHFDYKGILCSMASFKSHCTFGFWKASLLTDPHKILSPVGETAMGHFGRITALSDLPNDKILIEYIQEAARLNEEGIKLPATSKTAKAELIIPPDFMDAISENPAAWKSFEDFSYTNKKEYVELIEEAKIKGTRRKRMARQLNGWRKEK